VSRQGRIRIEPDSKGAEDAAVLQAEVKAVTAFVTTEVNGGYAAQYTYI
jgi:hypothetical protein